MKSDLEFKLERLPGDPLHFPLTVKWNELLKARKHVYISLAPSSELL